MNTSELNIDKVDGKTRIRIKNLGLAVKRGQKSWTVYCPNLKVLGYSNKSQRQALIDFEENLFAFFSIHLHKESLHQTLLSFEWKTPKQFYKENPNFAIPNEPALTAKDFEFALAA